MILGSRLNENELTIASTFVHIVKLRESGNFLPNVFCLRKCRLLQVTYVGCIRPALTLPGAEDDENDRTDSVDSSRQEEDVLPLGARRPVVRQEPDGVRCRDCRKIGYKLCQSHDFAGVERCQIKLVDHSNRNRQARAADGDEHQGDC